MGYRCIRPDGARPCIDIQTHDGHGNELAKPKKRFKTVRMGDILSWVDYTSRKHFVPTDSETIAQDKKDFAKIKEELESLNVNIPPDATFAECADSLARIKANVKAIESKGRRLFVPSTPEEEAEEEREYTNNELKQMISDLGGSFPTVVNKAQLKEILAGLKQV